MYFSKDTDSIPTFESPWIHRGWTPAAECQRIDAFELWGWRKLLRIPWTGGESLGDLLKPDSPKGNQS